MPRADELVCLACGGTPRTLDTQVESTSWEKVVRRRLVECTVCGTVRIYRVVTTIEDRGDYQKRYLREDSAAR